MAFTVEILETKQHIVDFDKFTLYKISFKILMRSQATHKFYFWQAMIFEKMKTFGI